MKGVDILAVNVSNDLCSTVLTLCYTLPHITRWADILGWQIKDGMTMTLHLADRQGRIPKHKMKEYEIDHGKVKRSIQRMLRAPEKCMLSDLYRLINPFGEMTPELADTIVQIACFNEVRYE